VRIVVGGFCPWDSNAILSTCQKQAERTSWRVNKSVVIVFIVSDTQPSPHAPTFHLKKKRLSMTLCKIQIPFFSLIDAVCPLILLSLTEPLVVLWMCTASLPFTLVRHMCPVYVRVHVCVCVLVCESVCVFLPHGNHPGDGDVLDGPQLRLNWPRGPSPSLHSALRYKFSVLRVYKKNTSNK
jgi:hypothetical protein